MRGLDLACEIFVADCYGLVPPGEAGAVKKIVDLGANIGYSATYRARRFPKAHIDGFEPHPLSRVMLSEMLAANKFPIETLPKRTSVYPISSGNRGRAGES